MTMVKYALHFTGQAEIQNYKTIRISAIFFTDDTVSIVLKI